MNIFSKSEIWKQQRAYFKEAGINAWADFEVPSYITSNPFIAKTYAQLILAFFYDNHKHSSTNEEPFYIIELGAGCAQFSYYLVKQLEELVTPNFVYVITDFVGTLKKFWLEHPRLQPFFEKGILDCAIFDIEKDSTINLVCSKKTISSNAPLQKPLITIANYFFDSIPNELFYIKNKEVKNVFVQTNFKDIPLKSAQDLLKKLQIEYSYQTINSSPFNQDLYSKIFNLYSQQLLDSHLLFPLLGMQTIELLTSFSQQKMLLLTADKGTHRTSPLDYKPAPMIVKHGSFSISVNYNAIKKHCEYLGGFALFPNHYYDHINVGCLIYGFSESECTNTINNYNNVIQSFGPDDFFSLKKHIQKQIDNLTIQEIFTYIRLSNYDPTLFRQFLGRLYQLKKDFKKNLPYTLLQITAKVWDNFYPLNQSSNLAFRIGLLLYELDFINESLSFFKLDASLNKDKFRALYHQAICYVQLEKPKKATQLLKEFLVHYPKHTLSSNLLEVLAKKD